MRHPNHAPLPAAGCRWSPGPRKYGWICWVLVSPQGAFPAEGRTVKQAQAAALLAWERVAYPGREAERLRVLAEVRVTRLATAEAALTWRREVFLRIDGRARHVLSESGIPGRTRDRDAWFEAFPGWEAARQAWQEALNAYERAWRDGRG